MISVDGYSIATGQIMLNYQLLPVAPANDSFATATPISGSTGTAQGSNVNATSEPGESAITAGSVPINSVWFAWPAPSAGTMVLNTCTSNFDTTLGVYTGNSVSALTSVATNDNDPLGCGNQSGVTFDAASGQTYYFAIDGYGAAEGSIALNWSFTVANTTPPDTTPPTVTGPTGVISAPQALSSTAKVHMTWASTDSSGVVGNEFQMKKGAGAWKPVALSSQTATSIDLTLTVGAAYHFRVRATDGAGNTSGWATTSSTKLRLVQENATSITYTGAWRRSALSGASGGYVKYATASGARAKLTFTGGAASFVATVSSARGMCEVWIDGQLVTTLDTYSTLTGKHQIVYSTPRLAYGSHTIEIRVTGTKRAASSSARVDVDAFLTWP